MNEHDCLEHLCSGVRMRITPAWKAQIGHNLLWQACVEAVAKGGPTRLDRWRQALHAAGQVIGNVFGSPDVALARAFLACADLAYSARALEKQSPPSIDTFISLLHTAQNIFAASCDCDVDLDARWLTDNVQELLGRVTSKNDPHPNPLPGKGEGNLETPDAPVTPVRAVDRIFTALAEHGICSHAPVRVGWAWEVTRALLGEPRRVVHRLAVPVAGTSQQGGFVATLELALLAPGGGESFHAPQDAFHTRPDARFVAAMHDAWVSARLMAQAHGVAAGLTDGRWRLKLGSGPAAYAEDRSASGAAARGWWAALTGKVPDAGLVVIAQVDAEAVTQLRGVDGVFAKTQAIVAEGRLGTIVVASTANQREAEDTLRQAGASHRMRVVNLTTRGASPATARAASLIQLVDIRDQLGMGLITYFQALIDLPDQFGPSYVGARRMSDLYIAPDVVPVETVERSQNPMTWENVWASHDRAVVLAHPGMGKTLLMQMTTRELARASLDDVVLQRKSVREVTIPVHLRLWDVAAQGSLATAVETSLRNTLLGAYADATDASFIEAVVEHVNAIVFTERCVLCLDALDEVSNDNRNALQQALEPLRTAACRLVVTSRPYGYQDGVLPLGHVSVYELVPFSPAQQQQFVDNWFRGDAARRIDMMAFIQEHPEFDNALLLTLCCAMAAWHNRMAALSQPGDVYRDIINTLLLGHDTPEELLVLLQVVAWRLFKTDPNNTIFRYAALRDAILMARKHLAITDDPQDLARVLRATGILVFPTPDQAMFVHPMFRDFLAAEYCVNKSKRFASVVKLRFVWRPEAAEMLRFLDTDLETPLWGRALQVLQRFGLRRLTWSLTAGALLIVAVILLLPYGYVVRGHLLFKRGDMVHATAAYQSAAEKTDGIFWRRQQAVVENRLGRIYAARGFVGTALTHYDNAIRLNENMAVVYANKAYLLDEIHVFDQKKFDYIEDVIELYGMALTRAPDDLLTRTLLQQAQWRQRVRLDRKEQRRIDRQLAELLQGPQETRGRAIPGDGWTSERLPLALFNFQRRGSFTLRAGVGEFLVLRTMQHLQASGRVVWLDRAITDGTINAQILLTGSMVRVGEKEELTLRLIDIETAEERARARGAWTVGAFEGVAPQLSNQLLQQLRRAYPLQGYITHVTPDGGVVLNIGAALGVTSGLTMSVLAPDGRLGRIAVTTVEPLSASAEVVTAVAALDPQKGWKVQEVKRP